MFQKREISYNRSIRKLSFVVSERCNLHCKYCYAWRCQFANCRKDMTREIAKDTVSYFLKDFKKIEFVQFFGGEPTINIDVIKFIIHEFDLNFTYGLLAKLPRFGIVTNGIFNAETLKILKKYNIETTVSIDGPAHIHNKLRIYKNGKPTHEKVIRSIKAIQNEGILLAAETVYTTLHISHNYSIQDSFKYCVDLGINKLIFQPAYPPAPKELMPISSKNVKLLLSFYKKAIDWWFEKLLSNSSSTLNVYFRDILVAIMNGVPTVPLEGCPAGIRDFSIGPSGKIYPCQLMYGLSDFELGNISHIKNIDKRSYPKSAIDYELCQHCFARYWCQPCAALNYFWGNMWKLPILECEIRKCVILHIAKLAYENFIIPENEITECLYKEIMKRE